MYLSVDCNVIAVWCRYTTWFPARDFALGVVGYTVELGRENGKVYRHDT
jgi:hypothetical protein